MAKKKQIKLDDIVVFKFKDKLIAHRVIFLDPDKKTVITKGDNNEKPDKKISAEKLLGKVEKIKRGGNLIHLDHIYLIQSSSYFEELNKLIRELNKKNINYIVLKGLPLYLHLLKKPPRRLYFDADILIDKKDLNEAKKILQNLGFRKKREKLYGIDIKTPTQINFIKKKKPFPVVVDLHLEPAIGFTKDKRLNKLGPDVEKLTDYFFANKKDLEIGETKYAILKDEPLLIFLLLHFYHHNFQGSHRINLIVNIVKKRAIKWNKIIKISKRLSLTNYLYPSCLVINRLYKKTFSPEVIKRLKPKSHFKTSFAIIVSKLVNPLAGARRDRERVKRLIFLFLFSDKNIYNRVRILFNKELLFIFYRWIKSFLSSSFKNSS